MKQIFKIKMQGKQFEKKHFRILFMLLCFVVTMVVLCIYSSWFFIALLAPIIWLLLRLRKNTVEKKCMADVICEIETMPDGIDVKLTSDQSFFCDSFFIGFCNIRSAHISETGKISIIFSDSKNKEKSWEFYPMLNDFAFWKKELNDFYS